MTYRKMGRAVSFWMLQLLMMGVMGSVHWASLAVENPQLSISQTEDDLVLSWPEWAKDWALEQSAHLEPPVSWRAIAVGTNSARVSPSPVTNGFFRLRKLSPTVAALTGHWRFDEGSGETAEDVVTNGPVVVFTNASWASGRVGAQSLRFNGGAAEGGGSRGWVSNSNHNVIPGAGQPFSASLWFSPDALPLGWQGLMGTSNGWSVALHSPGPGTNHIVFASTSLNVSARALLLPGQWYELTVTHDGARGNIYLDGNVLASEAGSLMIDDGPIYFGGGIRGYNSFLGRIDEVRTYKTALTADQISLAGHWAFDENAGTVVYDSSICGHHGCASEPAWTAGKVGTAMRLGSNAITIPNEHLTVLPPSGGPFSLSMWIYPYSLPTGRSGLISSGAGTTCNWELAIKVGAAGEKTLCFKSASGNGTLDLRAAVPLTNMVWSKLDITFNGGIATLYVNGRKIHHDSGAIQGGRTPITIGHVPGADNFDGLIDDLKIYRRERGASEIGPVATVIWETVFRNTATNMVLQGSGPAGKALTYSIRNTLSPSNGSITHLSGSPVVTYQAGGRKGPDALVFTVSDGEFTSIPATLSLSIVQPHWLSPGGGSVQPLDGSQPEQAWFAGNAAALDAIWKTNNYYDCFFYAPGTYETKGWRFAERPTVFAGCKHIGTGSQGPATTTLKLVGALEPWGEETIFGMRYSGDVCDGFELHNLVLDCNAENNPKYTRGEPIWIRVPLAATARVEAVTLRWNLQSTPSLGGGAPWQMGSAAELRICAPVSATNGLSTNCYAYSSTGLVDRVDLGTETDELTIHLDRRAVGIDFYSLAEVEIQGGQVSLPSATVPGGGESRFSPGDPHHSILRTVDNNMGTAWTSGQETNVEIFVPFARGRITQLTFNWNCQTLAGGALLGPASDYHIRARHPDTHVYFDVPFTRQPRAPDGTEINAFATPVEADGVMLILNARESGVDHYSLREISVQNAGVPVRLRLPGALNSLPWGSSILTAFDSAPETSWASFSQGAVGALAMNGNNLKFTQLKVIGFGTKAGREAFPFYLVNLSRTVILGNVLVEDCLFTEPATHNTDGITTVALAGNQGSLTNAVIRRCTVRGLKSHFRYSHGLGASHVENSLVEDCNDGIYFEPDYNIDTVGPILIRSNQFLNVENGIRIQFHPGRRFGAITYIGNEIVLAQARGWAFSACDLCGPGPSGTITNVTMLHNVIRYADWASRPANNEGAIYAGDIGNAVFANNVIALGSGSPLRVRNCPDGWLPPPYVPQLCPPHPQLEPAPQTGSNPPCLDVLPAGYRRVWSNNRDLSGALLPVRFYNSGTLESALQQQPPSELP